MGREAADEPQSFAVLIRGGTVYDGSGQPGVQRDIGIRCAQSFVRLK